MVLKFNILQTVALAVCVYYLGVFLKRKLSVLNKYCIPAPVVGGVIFALLAFALKLTDVASFEFDTTLQSVFMTMFFTTVGFTASLRILKKGGIAVFVFLGISTLLVVLQNLLGCSLSEFFGLDARLGLAMGSIPMVGGHGTAGSFGPLLEDFGVAGASVVAMASATFGLVMGSMIGGPLAKTLIERKGLRPSEDLSIARSEEEGVHPLSQSAMVNAFAIIFLTMGVGSLLSGWIEAQGITVPAYIGSMLVAALVRNVCDFRHIQLPYREIDISGTIGLTLYLSMALMTLKLWQLLDLAVPMITVLIAQTILMALLAYFICFWVMGSDFDAAVLVTALCGFGMGATPNAIANMDAITEKYGPSPKAYLVVPIVGGMFIDFVNSSIIVAFLNFLSR